MRVELSGRVLVWRKLDARFQYQNLKKEIERGRKRRVVSSIDRIQGRKGQDQTVHLR